jgi:hypothetical protein
MVNLDRGSATPSCAPVQIMLVSVQAAPNLLAALDPANKPRAAVLLVSQRMAKQGESLSVVLHQSSIAVRMIPLGNEHDFAALEEVLLNLAAEYQGTEVALNVTGGTKLMALAAQAVAVAAGFRVFYVDIDTDEIIWLAPQQARRKLGQQLRLRQYLRAYGFTSSPVAPRTKLSGARRQLLEDLVQDVRSLEHGLGQINWIAQRAEGPHLTANLSEEQLDSRRLDGLLRKFADAGVLEVTGGQVRFSDETQRQFVAGGWLEEYVYSVVEARTGPLGIRDKAANLAVEDVVGGVKNELDVAFMARNRLFVIECKTARMNRLDTPKANDSLFKLAEICRRVGGIGTRGMLASYRPLRDAEQRLATALGIKVICGSALQQLGGSLEQWIHQ